MPAIEMDLRGDGAFNDWAAEGNMQHLGNDAPAIRIGALESGMASGRTSVAIGIDVGDRKVLVETSLALFLMAADALRARFPNG